MRIEKDVVAQATEIFLYFRDRYLTRVAMFLSIYGCHRPSLRDVRRRRSQEAEIDRF